MSKRIVIIDGNSLINRAYYAMQRPMITKEGIYTQGIYGFINILNKIMDDYSPEYMTVAFDLKAPTFRHLEYENYKAGRKAMPPELAMEMPILKDILHAMNIKTLELEGFEADDIIGTVAHASEKAGLEPLIITGDKDALQLATKVTRILITKKGITDFDIYDYDKMIERYNLTPEQFIDLKGLMGDSSDNIPGIPGVGEKTGIKLLEQFGSIENLLSNTEEIANAKLRAKVEDNANLAVMSKKLATINTHVPIDLNFDSFMICEPDFDQLIKLYTKLEFNSFLKKLHPSEVSNVEKAEEVPVEKHMIKTQQDLKMLKVLDAEKNIYIKLFGDNSHIQVPQIYGIFLADGANACYVDCSLVDISTAVDAIDNMHLSFVGHDIKDDLYSMMFYGLKHFTVAFDTAIAEYVIEPTKSKYSLKAMALEKIKTDIDSFDDFMADSTQVTMFDDNAVKYMNFACLMVGTVLKIAELQKSAIEENHLTRVLYDVELPLIKVLASMEAEGICTDKQVLEGFGNEIKEKLDELELQIHDLAGEKFNINSPIQLGNILFEKLMLPAGKKTKRGYSTSADVLEKLRDKHPIINAVLEYRNLSKLNSTYVEGLIPLLCSDGKIRAHFQQTVTATGRISCTEPNLQNIPIRQELGRNLRKAFHAEKGYTLVGADYSQIELRVLAHLSQDKALIDAFNNNQDIHRITASRVLGIPLEQVTPNERSKAKAVNFGVIYGMSGFGLSEQIGVTRKEAEQYINEYFKKHESVKRYMDEQIAQCKQTGQSHTILGRIRQIHEINASAYMVRQLGERLAMNSPIQGSAADIIKIAMVKVYDELSIKYPESKLILQVHDELIINARNEDLEEIKELLVRNMENAMNLSVKLEADLNTGYTWYELK